MKDREESDTQWFLKRLEADRKQRVERLAEAKKAAKVSGKEPFDFEQLNQMVDLTPDLAQPGWEPTREFIEACEYKYYVYCPKIMTLEDFAKYLEMMDRENP